MCTDKARIAAIPLLVLAAAGAFVFIILASGFGLHHDCLESHTLHDVQHGSVLAQGCSAMAVFSDAVDVQLLCMCEGFTVSPCFTAVFKPD